jgi:hypothetical protein
MNKQSNFIKTNLFENISSNIILFIKNNKNKNNTLLAIINFINVNKIIIKYKTNALQKNICICLYKNDKIIGTFEISNFGNKNSMSINIEDDINYRNKGLSRLMIVSMIYILKHKINEFSNLKLNAGFLLNIDTNASAGFWEKIGMTENRYYLRRNYGYEMDMTLRQLEKWSLGTTNLFTF